MLLFNTTATCCVHLFKRHTHGDSGDEDNCIIIWLKHVNDECLEVRKEPFFSNQVICDEF